MWHFIVSNEESSCHLTILFVTQSSCKNYYNDTIQWIDKIPVGTSVSNVKRTQPDFVTIEWSKPDTINQNIRYMVSKIKGSNDILNMNHYLIFQDDKFIGRRSRK